VGFKVGLALGGGAARGLAHLGVLKALSEAGIPIHVITGTSIGAIVASIYAANPDADAVIHQVESYLNSDDFNQTKLDFIRKSDQESDGKLGQLKKMIKTGFFLAISMRRSSFISEENIRSNLEKIIPSKNIEDCPLALGLVSMNLDDGKEVVFHKGNLIDKVLASCAIPGIFPPVFIDEQMLVDGSWVNPVPVTIARQLGADFVIAVDVAPTMNQGDHDFNGWNISLRANEGSRVALKDQCLRSADHVLSLNDIDIHWADFLQLDKCVAEGEQVVLQEIEALKKKTFWSRLQPRFIRRKYGIGSG